MGQKVFEGCNENTNHGCIATQEGIEQWLLGALFPWFWDALLKTRQKEVCGDRRE